MDHSAGFELVLQKRHDNGSDYRAWASADRRLAHRMVDDAITYIETVRERLICLLPAKSI
jgi:hypothetical protein